MKACADEQLRYPTVAVALVLVSVFVTFVLVPVADATGLSVALVGFSLFYRFSRTHRGIGSVLLAAFVLRGALAIAGHYVVDLPEATSDARSFDAAAFAVAAHGFPSALGEFTAGSYFFAWMVGVLYSITGHAPLLGLFVNVFLGTGVVLNVYLISREFRDQRTAVKNAAVACLFPALVLYSAVLLREAGWVYFSTATVFLFVRWHKAPRRLVLLAGWILCGVITGLFHTYGLILLGSLTLLAVLRLAQMASDAGRRLEAGTAAIVLMVAMSVVALTGIGMGKFSVNNLNLAWLTSLQEMATRDRAAYPAWLIISSWTEMLWKLPARIGFLLFGPFPWMARTPLDLVGSVDGLLYVAICVALVTAWVKHIPVRRQTALWVALAFLLIVISLTVGNYGTAFRHRAKLLGLLIVLLPMDRLTLSLPNWSSTHSGRALPVAREGRLRILNAAANSLKRLFDIICAVSTIVVLSPLMAPVALLILIRADRPILFRQTRAGRHGRPFTFYKFRTMTNERDENGDLLPDDQRITRLGAFLRKTTIDELPSLFNVLKGDMSLVGPRPLFHDYVPLYTSEQARRLEVKPGLTGWAVIKGRNALSWEERFRLDVWYVDNRSFSLDVKILFLTVFKILKRDGVSAEGEATMPRFRGSARRTTETAHD